MKATRDHHVILDQEFLELRCRLLEIAATLDRLDRAPETTVSMHDPRLGQIRESIAALSRPDPDRAQTIQLLFSLEYDPDWKRPKPSAPRD